MKRSLYALLIVSILIVAPMYWRYEAEPVLLLKKVRQDQMVAIEEGICLFDEKHNRLPTNLLEVVNAGFLPKRSNIYACALKYGSFNPPEIGFENADYLLVASADRVALLVKPELVELIKRNPRFSSISSRHLSNSILSGQRIVRTNGK